MRELIVVGRPNSGKTMFTLNFAAFLGAKTVDVTSRTYDGMLTCRHFSIDEAKKELCGLCLHKTRCIQSITLNVKFGKTCAIFKMTDTCGLTESIHPDENIRKGMAQTLGILRYADFIFHIIDLSTVTKDYINSSNNIDREIYQYGITKQNYILLANKIDLPTAKENFNKLVNHYPQTTILPISALHQKGFKEVKACVARNV